MNNSTRAECALQPQQGSARVWNMFKDLIGIDPVELLAVNLIQPYNAYPDLLRALAPNV